MLVEECCNAPDSMRQVSASFSPSLPCHLLACCILPCHHLHHVIMCIALHTCSSHASEHFSHCPFRDPALLCPPAPPFASFHVRVLNILGMARGLPSGLGIAPVDHLSSFGSFGARFVLQRLSAYPQRPILSCSPTPLPKWPKTQQTPLHALSRSITIAWPKTAPHLESPSSLYLFICVSPENSQMKP